MQNASTYTHTHEKSGWRRGWFGRQRFKDRLIRERARNRYRGGAAAPNLRDFFQNYEAARNPRDTSPLIKRIAGLGGWFKFCTCPTVTRKKKKEKGNSPAFLPFFYHLPPPSPPFFPPPRMKGRDRSLPPALLHFYRAIPTRSYRRTRFRNPFRPPFKRLIPTSGYQRGGNARLFFPCCAVLANPEPVNHTETASWEICSDTLGQLKYPKVDEKLVGTPRALLLAVAVTRNDFCNKRW